MPRYLQEVKDKAIALRKQGYSLNQIVSELGISKSTASLWVHTVTLDMFARDRLNIRRVQAVKRGATTRKLILDSIYQSIDLSIVSEFNQPLDNKFVMRLLCSFLYWGEGTKTGSAIKFTNSDPKMIQVFLHLFRSSFSVVEQKFGATLHLHEYHSEYQQLIFWSKMTKIPISKINIYKKPNSGINIRKGYPGCISVYYCDSKLFRYLTGYYRLFNYGGFV